MVNGAQGAGTDARRVREAGQESDAERGPDDNERTRI